MESKLFLLGRLRRLMLVMVFLVFMVLREGRSRNCQRNCGGQDNSSKFLHSPIPFSSFNRFIVYAETVQRTVGTSLNPGFAKLSSCECFILTLYASTYLGTGPCNGRRGA